MDFVERGIQASDLRALADAIEAQSRAGTIPGISAPSKIVFADHHGNPLTGYGSNPTLLAAIEREVRLSWDELRARARQRLDDSVTQLTAKVSADLGRSALADEGRGT